MRALLAASLSVLLAVPAAAGPVADREAVKAAYEARGAGVKEPGNRPFVKLVKGKNAPGKIVDRGRVIVLIHGLTDSPYFMDQLGDFFVTQGYDVVGVLLPGHGTKPEDLHTATLKQWRDEVDVAIATAQQLGGELSLGGFSTGGALALDAVTRHFRADPAHTWNYGDIFLFSPAVDLPTNVRTITNIGCKVGVSGVKKWVDAKAEETNPHKYGKMSTNAVCQLWAAIQANKTNRAKILSGLKGHGVFTVASGADSTVSFDEVVALDASLPEGASGVFDPYDKAEGIAHAAVTRSETNPRFGDLKSKLAQFIERCHAGSSPRATQLLPESMLRDKKGG